jgi:hypothetical protein
VLVKAMIAAMVGLGTLLTPAAVAKPASIPYSDDALSVAYAPGRVLVAERDPFGVDAIVVRELKLSDHSERVVVEIAVQPDERPFVSLVANGSGYLVMLGGVRDRLILGGYDGSLRTLADCAAARDDSAPPWVLAPGTTGFAFSGARCGLPAVATVSPDGIVTPVAGADSATGLAYAEPYLAIAAPGPGRVVDLASGAERRVPPGLIGTGVAMQVLADGTLAFASDALDGVRHPGLYVWPPGALTPTLLDARAFRTAVAAAAGRVLFDTISVPQIVGLGGGIARAVNAPGAALPLVLGFDGTQATLESFSCLGKRQITLVEVDEPPEAGAENGCPVRFAQRAARFGASGRTRVSVRCSNGCRDELMLVQESTRRRPCDGAAPGSVCGAVATARLDLPASNRTRHVTLKLTPKGRRLRGRTIAVRTTFLGDPSLTRVGEIRRAAL